MNTLLSPDQSSYIKFVVYLLIMSDSLQPHEL